MELQRKLQPSLGSRIDFFLINLHIYYYLTGQPEARLPPNSRGEVLDWNNWIRKKKSSLHFYQIISRTTTIIRMLLSAEEKCQDEGRGLFVQYLNLYQY